MQDGSLYVVGDTCYLKYYIIEDDGRVHKTIQLCKRSDVYDWWKKRGRWGFSSAVHDLQRETMAGLRAKIERAEPSNGSPTSDMRVTDFWEQVYLPYLEEIVTLTGQPRRKPSTVRGFKQIWNQHLKRHFGTGTLKEYEPAMGSRFLRTLTSTQGKSTLKHIKALGSALFGHAVEVEIIKVNPWREVKIPKDAVESAATPHYTLEEAEDIISSLVDHVDCQLVMALSCFLGLRPGEIAALKWEEFDKDTVSIRRSVVRGVVGTPKTPESLATLPLLAQVRIPLELWRQQVKRDKAELKAKGIDDESNGYVFESKNGTPVDLHNMTARIIRPHVEGSHYKLHGKTQECVRCNKVPKSSGKWKTLYAGRRGAATAVIEANNGNLAIGQALLRHKSQITTATFYKKAVTPETLRNGMKMLELAAKNGSEK